MVEIPHQVRLIDVLPTILEMLEIRGPAELDGASLVPYLSGAERSHRMAYSETFFREELAAANPAYPTLAPLRSLRIEDRFKLFWEQGAERPSVVDLLSDPHELRPQILDPSSPLGRELRAEAKLLLKSA